MIKPTVGRIVWFWKAPHDGATIQREQPLAAIVAYVWSERCVNLAFWDADGRFNSAQSVQLLQEGDEKPSSSRYCEWMPYQVGQAKKYEALEKELGKS